MRRRIDANAIDLIVLDVGLPDINGFELCRAIRQRYPVPVIFLTARCDEIDRVVGLEIGADDYMVKPFSPRELAAWVRAVLRRTQPDNGPLPRSPTAPLFQVDPPKRRIHFCGQLLSLSRYEYDILDLLISGTAFYFLTYGFLGTIRTRYLEGVEEVPVDQARLLAGLVSAEMADGRSYPQRLQKVFDEAYRNDRYLRGRRCVRQH